ncbi:MAG: ABC transporter ATP-binding protein [Gammaproteobacteria bacterium]|nr:ABC transporter ATP-binding protein [Gammaproteobacteria bacterium]
MPIDTAADPAPAPLGRSSAPSKLEIVDLSVGFGGLSALDSVNLAVPEAEIHGIIGPNGAGKTTLLNVVCGIYPPTRGDVRLDGHSLVGMKFSKIAGMGLSRTFQTSRMFKGMTVLENVMTGLHGEHRIGPLAAAFGRRRVLQAEREAADRAQRILDFVGMSRFESYESTGLSFGQQRVVEIARALVREPKVLLLDEPAVGLSEPRVEELDRLLRRIRDERGVTILMIEHVVQLVMGVCDSITVLNSGRKIASGDPRTVSRHPAVIEAYLGTAIDA